jgi:hypothetical protein
MVQRSSDLGVFDSNNQLKLGDLDDHRLSALTVTFEFGQGSNFLLFKFPRKEADLPHWAE